MMALLKETILQSRAEGFQRVRLLGHMEWAIEGWPGGERLAEYESLVNNLLNHLKQPAICAYDISRFSGLVIMDVLRAHPYTIIDGVLRENPYYVPPEKFLGPQPSPHPTS
jgi:hypothetical protein